MKGTKLAGGTDGMHIRPDKHPFSSGPFRGSSKTARTVGVGPNPGGGGDMISANASMRKKRPLNGPGDAK